MLCYYINHSFMLVSTNHDALRFVFLIDIVRDLMFWQDSTPRIVKFGEYPGGPFGGTHVADVSIINSLKVIIIF